MRSFLQEVAEDIYRRHPRLDEVTMVFPNRRAALYFRKHLGDLLERPAFPPALMTIEDFLGHLAALRVPDKLELVFRLYRVYDDVMRSENNEEILDGIEQFYFWGEMLLRDFDEIDRYMVDAGLLFKDLSNQKELDANFDFLTPEQREFLKGFWSGFDPDQSVSKKKFLYLWRRLPLIYAAFRDSLQVAGLAYDGMLHRSVAESLNDNPRAAQMNAASLYFAGFNALTAAEEKVISFFVANGASVFWDMDASYVNNAAQEAGKFLREYQQHPVLGKTFPQDIPAHPLLGNTSAGRGADIRIFGAAQPVGQAKVMAQVLRESLEQGMKPEETLIVLPDEKLLLPVLHGVAGSVEKMNVTMGFPLGSTPVFNLMELILDLRITRRQDHFNHQQVLAVLGHPYVVAADAVSANAKRKEILRHNWVHVPAGFLAADVPLHRLIFRHWPETPDNLLPALIDYLRDIVAEVGTLRALGDLDKEYAFHFHKLLNRLAELFERHALTGAAPPGENASGTAPKAEVSQLKSFLRLFPQLIRSHKIPFTGEPLKGLQVMGVLETRNLDFKNVFILSMNEGAFPSVTPKGSYIPHAIRKAYHLPTVDHQDAIHAYLFYRILQRAEKVSIFYNAETDILGQGEMSRYLQQLLYESGLPVTKKVLHNAIAPQGIHPIIITKDAAVMENLLKLNDGNRHFRGISPSALNAYLECRLKFYFRHVARIREPDEVEEELDARVLGNFLHEVMEHFYKAIAERTGRREILPSDYDDYGKEIDRLIDQAFIRAYRLDPDREVPYAGQRLVVREIVKRFAHRIIEIDKAYAPFVISGLEQEGLTFPVEIGHPPFTAVVGGKIDRVDRKGDEIRVIDYKTGKDKLNFDSIASLFARDTARNKAAFQTVLYALLYHGKGEPGARIVPGLINRMNLFDDNFSFGLRMGKEKVSDVNTLLPEFSAHLRDLIEELFDPQRPFDQTRDRENCRNCPYGQICYR